MEHSFDIPHRISPGMCPVNGIRDLVHWRTGRDWTNEFVHGLGQGGGFAYLRINPADPPRQVYWGIASPRQHKYLADLFGATFTEYENRSFKNAWKKAQDALTSGTPPIIGPLDMFHLPFYPGIYHARHIPIHFLLLVGCDNDNAYVHDTGCEDVQKLPLAELELAWNVHVPGLGRRNRLAVLDIPHEIAPTEVLIRKSIQDQCSMMLNPPTSMLGIPAMQKLSREVAHWPSELSQGIVDKCLLQVREYLNSPPDVSGNHLTAGRDLYIAFLEQAAEMTGLDFSAAIACFRTVISIIPELVQTIQQNDLRTTAAGFGRIAEAEKQAFTLLSSCVSEPG
jgi:hypothetical protein